MRGPTAGRSADSLTGARVRPKGLMLRLRCNRTTVTDSARDSTRTMSESPGIERRRGAGAGGEIRTRTRLPSAEFKSAASALPPLRRTQRSAPIRPSSWTGPATRVGASYPIARVRSALAVPFPAAYRPGRRYDPPASCRIRPAEASARGPCVDVRGALEKARAGQLTTATREREGGGHEQTWPVTAGARSVRAVCLHPAEEDH